MHTGQNTNSRASAAYGDRTTARTILSALMRGVCRLLPALSPALMLLFIDAAPCAAQAWYPLGPDDRNWAGLGTRSSMAIGSTGEVYVAYADEEMNEEITVRKYASGKWEYVGSRGFSSGWTACIDIAISGTGTPFVSFHDQGNGYRATVMSFDGSMWLTVGNPGFSASPVQGTSLAIDGNGKPNIAYSDAGNGGKLNVMTFSGGVWIPVGTAGFTPNGAYCPSLAFDGSGRPTVAFDDAVSTKACVMRYDGAGWIAVGNLSFSAGSAYYITLAMQSNGEPQVAFPDGTCGYRGTVMKYDGSSWITVGAAGFTSSSPNDPVDIVCNGSGETWVAVKYGSAEAYRYDGSNWVSVGTSHALTVDRGVAYLSLAFDQGNVPYMAFSCSDGGSGRSIPYVISYNGSVWNPVGDAGFSLGIESWQHMATDASGIPFVAYIDSGLNGRVTVKKLTAGSWNPVGSPGFSAGEAAFPSIAVNSAGEPYVAYKDWANGGRVTVMKYNGSGWSPVGSAGFSSSVGASGIVGPEVSLALDSNGDPYVAFSDLSMSGKATVMKWNGSAWSIVGTAGITAMEALYIDIAVHTPGQPCIVFMENTVANSVGPYKTCAMMYAGGVWSYLGGAPAYLVAPTSGATYPHGAFNTAGELYVAFCNSSNSGRATVKKLLAGSWVDVGSGVISSGAGQYTSIAINSAGEPVVAFRDQANGGHTTVMKYASSAWTTVGTAGFGMQQGHYHDIALSATGEPIVVYETTAGLYAWQYDPSLALSTGSVTGSPFCGGASVSVPYTAAGTYSGGNTFTAQLSNPAGAFAPPTDIGSTASSSSGTITATIPAAAQAGTAYRIRVVSSTPALYGSDNGGDLVVMPSDPAGLTWTGAVSSAWNTVGNWDNPCAVPDAGDDVIIPSGTTPPSSIPAMTLGALTLDNAAGCALAGDLTLDGTLTLSSGALSIGAHTLTLNGSIAQTGGTLTGGASSKLAAAGSGAALALPGVSLHTLDVSRPNGITLAGDVSISTALALNTGVVALGAHSVTIGPGGSISGGSASSFLFTGGAGALTQQDLGGNGRSGFILFPVGPTAAVYTPLSMANEWDDDAFSVRVSPGAFLGGTTGAQIFEHVVGLTWHLGEATAGRSNLHVQVQWNAGDELSGFNRNACALVRHDGSAWGHTGFLAAAAGSGPWTQIAYSNRALSPLIVADPDAVLGIDGRFRGGPGGGYAMADAPPAPLPVELRSFTASVVDRSHVRLRWTTATETDNHGFFPERAAAHPASPWLPLGFVQGAGSAAEPRHYEYVDALPQPARDGEVFRYRLRQIDRTGGERLHPAVEVLVGALPAEPWLDVPYPDPCTSSATFTFTLPQAGGVSLTIVDARGTEVLRIIDGASCDAGAHAYAVRTDALGAGLYFARLLTPGGIRVQRFTVVR
jgi:hypothetical protein